jgi:hypothetical protein
VMGAIGEHAGARVALAVAGMAAILSAGWATWANRRALVPPVHGSRAKSESVVEAIDELAS